MSSSPSIDVSKMSEEFHREHRILQEGNNMLASAASICAEKVVVGTRLTAKDQCKIALMYLIAADQFKMAASNLNSSILLCQD